MTNRHSSQVRRGVAGLAGRLMPVALAALVLMPAAAVAEVSYIIHGRAYSIHVPEAAASTSTSAIPAVTMPAAEPEEPADDPVPLPGVTIEVYMRDTGALLGTGRANREGFYNVPYSAPAATHTVRFLVFLDATDGSRELVGEVDRTAGGDLIEIDPGPLLFPFTLEVPTASAVHGGTAVYSPSGEFLFTEVGDVDMDDILDEEADGCDPVTECGLTKATAESHLSTPPRVLGPGFAFGYNLELYGLFGETSGAAYYRINYTGESPGTVSGSIDDPLFKKNYVLSGLGVDVYRVRMGPDPAGKPAALAAETNVYQLDEPLAGTQIPGEPPGTFYSSYWTELGLRAIWRTRGLPDGTYTLEIEAWDAAGNPIAASTNHFATLNLHLVNTPPESTIHNLRYLNGDIVLSDADPCQTVLLNKISSPTFDDDLQFEITAQHPSGFLRNYTLHAWYGHNTSAGQIASGTAPAVNLVVPTPASITYQTCAYRFRLRVVPKITNGYYIIYVRDDNWYAAISVLEP